MNTSISTNPGISIPAPNLSLHSLLSLNAHPISTLITQCSSNQHSSHCTTIQSALRAVLHGLSANQLQPLHTAVPTNNGLLTTSFALHYRGSQRVAAAVGHDVAGSDQPPLPSASERLPQQAPGAALPASDASLSAPVPLSAEAVSAGLTRSIRANAKEKKDHRRAVAGGLSFGSRGAVRLLN
eukprot:1940013-Pyramimonas_sp.AAC.1